MINANLQKDTIFYFLGIGGIGMSALARFFHQKGHIVLGYDKTSTPLTQQLEMEGMDITYEDDLLNMPSLLRNTPTEKVWVCYTPAIPQDSILKNWFQDHEFPMMKRSELLGKITERYQTIAVAGTHGKTTTSSLITYVLTQCGFPVNAFLGGISANFNSNLVTADSHWVVVEADEFDRSFLTLSPQVAVITAVDPDHLDIYGDAQTFEKGFQDFAKKVVSNGKIWAQADISTVWKDLASGVSVQSYSNGVKGSAHAREIRVENGKFVFDYVGETVIGNVECGLAGIHNIENAVAAISVALQLGCKAEDIKNAIGSFKGVSRRFERVMETANCVVIDDYAHHPTEIHAAVASARMLFPNKKMGGIFQPHLYSRTRDFSDGFAHELGQLDAVILLPIYPARELPIAGVDSQSILDKILISDKKVLEKSELLEIGIPGDWEVVLFLGAGDIDQLVRPVCQGIQKG
jgi:UDP-N-acetylmuramate--alanine ligase